MDLFICVPLGQANLACPQKLAAFYRYMNEQLHATAFGGAPKCESEVQIIPLYSEKQQNQNQNETKQNKKPDWWLIMALELYTTRGYSDFDVAM